MNADDSWKAFGDVYATIERDICRRSYKKHIEPVLMQSSRGIRENMMETFEEFKKDCVLENEINIAREKLKVTLNEKSEQEEKERRRQEEEQRRRKQDEEKKRQEEEKTWESYKTYVKYIGLFALGGWMFSDKDLKSNVTVLPSSEYNDIGLRGVCWEWNEVAKKSYGLTGEDCRVIAQEVQMLYSWAVIDGKDGYLRVQYEMLREMINLVNIKNLLTYEYKTRQTSK